MASDHEHELVTASQIRRYRGLTTVLSWLNIATPNVRIKKGNYGSLRSQILFKGEALADILVREDETVAVTYNHTEKRLQVLATTVIPSQHPDKAAAPTSAYIPEEALRFHPAYDGDLPAAFDNGDGDGNGNGNGNGRSFALPLGSAGWYLKHRSSGVVVDGKNTVPPFTEHCAVVCELLKRSHRTAAHPGGAGPSALNRDLLRYLWLAAEPAVNARIAAGGAPQPHGAAYHPRNLFWALTQGPAQLQGLAAAGGGGGGCADAAAVYAQGLRPERKVAFRGLRDAILGVANDERWTSDMMLDLDEIAYDARGRMVLQGVLVHTLSLLWVTFRNIRLTKLELMAAKKRFVEEPHFSIRHALQSCASRLAGLLDEQANDATRHMQVLLFLTQEYEDLLREHFRWLQAALQLRHSRDVKLAHSYFWERPVSPFQACKDAEMHLHRGGFDAIDALEGFPPRAAGEGGEHSQQGEGCASWSAVALYYLKSIVLHYRGVCRLVRIGGDGNDLALRRSKWISQVGVDCTQVVVGPALDHDTMSSVNSVLRGLVKEPDEDIGLDEDDVQRLALKIAFMSPEQGLDPAKLLQCTTLFEGTAHCESILLSLHLYAERSKKWVKREKETTPPPVSDTAQEDGPVSQELRDLSRQLQHLVSAIALSKGCCAGCYQLVEYMKYEYSHGDRDDYPLYPASNHARWTPCTIPPWLSKRAASFMISRAEKALLRWADQTTEVPESEED
ncbi:uncharacterized protein E0L32_008087 [Thyridium curvatum]|uniref:Uncharacterized protein n=1 Tax=Thyridium curvatum TaxID=1093900 RepID=A0A507B177_9PEZI|nr:uncharacterized protein E0L32_008087 [Thyridium curvatum]TPX10881.1 hypothetical protein E0L32_008087 [Thyridium curvatum]